MDKACQLSDIVFALEFLFVKMYHRVHVMVIHVPNEEFTHTHTRTHARTHTHMHMEICNLGIETVNMFVWSLVHDCLDFKTCLFGVWSFVVTTM